MRTKGAVGGYGLSEEFAVNIGLRHGSALSPLLFIVVMELISRKISMKDVPRKMMYAGHNSRDQTITTGSVGGMEGGVHEARTENVPGEDRSDVGWTPERGVEHQV